MTTYAVVHQHNYGIDCNVYSTAEDAYLSAGCIIMDWIQEIEDVLVQREIVSSLKIKDFSEAIRLYNVNHAEESITIQVCMPIKNEALSTQFTLAVTKLAKDLGIED